MTDFQNAFDALLTKVQSLDYNQSECDLDDTTLDARDADNCTLLHHAIRNLGTEKDSKLLNDYKKVAELLISKKIGINEVNQDGCSPLHYACYGADTDLVGKLLDAGSKISHKDEDGLRATDFAAAADKVEILSALFEKAAALGIKDERIKRWKDEALFIAAENNRHC